MQLVYEAGRLPLDYPSRIVYCDSVRKGNQMQFNIEAWYDRSIRLWTAVWLDDEGNQHGVAQYAVRRADKDALVKLMKTSEPTSYQI